MTFDEILDHVRLLLQQEGRVAYRVLKRRFGIDDDYIEDVKADLIDAKRIAVDENGKVLVWVGATPVPSAESRIPSSPQPPTPQQTPNSELRTSQPPSSYTPARLAERIRAEQAALEARGATDGERKTITALFADLKGSTALIEGLDPEEARAIIDPALHLMMDAVHQYDGYVAQALGDGIFALFGAPLAHEDHPQRALYAALRMQEAMRRYADTLRQKGSPPLLMRVEINTGEVVLRSIRKDDRHADYVPVGHSTNLAARMEQLANPGSIVVSAYTHRLTDGYFAFKDLGPTQIKGVEDALNIYEVLGAGLLRTRLQVTATRRGLTRFVGRQSEMEQLTKALEHAKAGHGQIVGVMGEPGLGKSRLFYEFKLLSVTGCLMLEAYSVSHGKATAYLAEAINHLTAALELLKTLPDTAARARQELTLHLSLGASLMATQGYTAAEVEQTYIRAQELCLQMGEPLQVAQVLYGLWVVYAARGNLTAARALAEQFLPVAQQQQDSTLSLVVHAVLGEGLLWLGEFTSAQAHAEQAAAFYAPEHHRDLAYQMGQDLGLSTLGFAAETLWYRGYPDQALERARHALSLAQTLSHPFSLANVLVYVAVVHLCRHEDQEAIAQVEALLTLAHKYGFAWWLGFGSSLQGWALVERAAQSGTREEGEAGQVRLQEGLAALRATEAEIYVPLFLGALAQGYAQGGQTEEGLRVIAEALAMVEKNEERWNEAELYRLKGEMTLQQENQKTKGKNQKVKIETDPRPLNPDPQGDAEACFLKAIEIAQKQQAKSLELRAVMGLARLWQQQNRRHEAHQVLSKIYGWFTEGFDTKDLQEAQALIEELS